MPSASFPLSTGRVIGGDAPVFIVAELGTNHDGDMATAERLVDMAADAGADAVKLQVLIPGQNYAPDHPSYRQYQRMDLGVDNYRRLAERARGRGLVLFATPDTASLALVPALGMPLVKISSGMLTDLPHLREASKLGVPMVLSTGMSFLNEVVRSVRWCREHGAAQLAVLHCTSLYPAPRESLHLRALDSLAAATGAVIGYSDHSEGTLAGVAAVARGAKLIEKHVTLDRSGHGGEHHFAADPAQFAALVRDIRSVEQALGHGQKEPVQAERPQREVFRRCIVARRALEPGTVLTKENIGILRPSPGTAGLEPAYYDQILGLATAVAVPLGSGITLDMLGRVLLQAP